jgi:hypothetical protein
VNKLWTRDHHQAANIIFIIAILSRVSRIILFMQWVSNQFATMSLLINLFVISMESMCECVCAARNKIYIFYRNENNQRDESGIDDDDGRGGGNSVCAPGEYMKTYEWID